MHETKLVDDLLRKVESLAREQGATRVAGVTVRLGASAPFEADHLRDHFEMAAQGTLADGARLTVETSTDAADPHAGGLWLVGLDVEE